MTTKYNTNNLNEHIQEWQSTPFTNIPFSQGYAIQEIIKSMKIASIEKIGWGVLEDKTLLCIKTSKQYLFFTDNGVEVEALYFEGESL